MISFRYGSMFDNYGGEILINPVNTEGIIGKGVSVEFKNKLVENTRQYLEICKNGFYIGDVLYVEEEYDDIKYRVLNIPTKTTFKSVSTYDYIINIIKYLKKNHLKSNLRVPPLGCGSGKLEWLKVRDLFMKYLSESNIILYTPYELTIDEAVIYKLFYYIYKDKSQIDYPILSKIIRIIDHLYNYKVDLTKLYRLQQFNYLHIDENDKVIFDLTENSAIDYLVSINPKYELAFNKVLEIFNDNFSINQVNKLYTSLYMTGSV